MIKVLIVDDHAVVRRGLKQILEDDGEIRVSDVATPREFLECIRSENWDAVVLDLDMPDKSGLELLSELKNLRPNLPALILSIHPEEQFAVRALKAGADGYLNKSSAPDELVKAVRKVVSGGKYISETVADQLLFSLKSNIETAPHEQLSDREYQVMCLIASGKTVTLIAEQLALSIPTISTYRTRILEKMKMLNNAELTHYAIKKKLIE